MILTTVEMIDCLAGGPENAARAVEAAVIAKLCTGTVLRPYRADCFDPEAVVVRQDEAEAAIAAARLKALEEAIAALEALWHSSDDSTRKCIEAIRALKGTTP